MKYVVGLDIGGSSVKSVCADSGGEVMATQTAALNTATDAWMEGVRNHVREIEGTRGEAMGIGVSAPGIAAADGSSIWWMQGRLGELQGLNWREFLARKNRVPVLNDAQSALLGEVWKGAAAGSRNVILLTLGTGVGGAAMVDGRVLRGELGRAGHLGHISLNPAGVPDIVNTPGSLEDAIGNITVARRSGGKFKDTLEMLGAAEGGDQLALKLWEESVVALAAGIASLINVLDCEVVIIGGGIAEAGEKLFGPLGEAMERFEWRPHGRRARIVRAQHREYAGALGAAKNALDQLNEEAKA